MDGHERQPLLPVDKNDMDTRSELPHKPPTWEPQVESVAPTTQDLAGEPQVESASPHNQDLESDHNLNLDGAAEEAAKLESKNEKPSGASMVIMSEPDETSSIQSYNDPVFDDLESVLSSVSSLGSDAQAVFVGAFVDLLLRDVSVDRMIAGATSDAGIGAERFRRAFSRILKTYSRDLRNTLAHQQQKEQKQQRVVTFISRKTIQASSLLVTRYKERAPKSDNSALDKVGQYLDGLESDNSNSSDDEEPDPELTLAGLENFLLQGKPFKALKWHLRSLIIPNQCVT